MVGSGGLRSSEYSPFVRGIPEIKRLPIRWRWNKSKSNRTLIRKTTRAKEQYLLVRHLHDIIFFPRELFSFLKIVLLLRNNLGYIRRMDDNFVYICHGVPITWYVYKNRNSGELFTAFASCVYSDFCCHGGRNFERLLTT